MNRFVVFLSVFMFALGFGGCSTNNIKNSTSSIEVSESYQVNDNFKISDLSNYESVGIKTFTKRDAGQDKSKNLQIVGTKELDKILTQSEASSSVSADKPTGGHLEDPKIS